MNVNVSWAVAINTPPPSEDARLPSKIQLMICREELLEK